MQETIRPTAKRLRVEKAILEELDAEFSIYRRLNISELCRNTVAGRRVVLSVIENLVYSKVLTEHPRRKYCLKRNDLPEKNSKEKTSKKTEQELAGKLDSQIVVSELIERVRALEIEVEALRKDQSVETAFISTVSLDLEPAFGH